MSEADPDTVRVRLAISYDGTGFSGWAVQPGQRTVQGVLQDALAAVLRLPAPPQLTVAGRTDAGVHALGQVAHVNLPAAIASAPPVRDGGLARRWGRALPPDVRVRSATVAAPGFDARFSARWRRYEYRIGDADTGVSPLRRGFVAAWRRRLDAAAMHAAGAALLGLHDFAAFCKPRPGATTIRTLQQLDIGRHGDEVLITVAADAFCHSMVRSLVGALAAVGEGRRDAAWLAGLLDAAQRANDVTVAPAHGLTLVEVGYPPDDELAARAEATRALRVLPVDGRPS